MFLLTCVLQCHAAEGQLLPDWDAAAWQGVAIVSTASLVFLFDLERARAEGGRGIRS